MDQGADLRALGEQVGEKYRPRQVSIKYERSVKIRGEYRSVGDKRIKRENGRSTEVLSSRAVEAGGRVPGRRRVTFAEMRQV